LGSGIVSCAEINEGFRRPSDGSSLRQVLQPNT
jgi:hypothetical protein